VPPRRIPAGGAGLVDHNGGMTLHLYRVTVRGSCAHPDATTPSTLAAAADHPHNQHARNTPPRTVV
jgi:hypothetical protein